MTVWLLTEHHWEFLSLKEGCTGLSESTLVKMPHCWKSHVAAQIAFAVSTASPFEMSIANRVDPAFFAVSNFLNPLFSSRKMFKDIFGTPSVSNSLDQEGIK